MPARVSLLTGLYPHNSGHGIWSNALNYHVPPAEATMFQDIKAAGYTTAQIGKTHWTSGPSLGEAEQQQGAGKNKQSPAGKLP